MKATMSCPTNTINTKRSRARKQQINDAYGLRDMCNVIRFYNPTSVRLLAEGYARQILGKEMAKDPLGIILTHLSPLLRDGFVGGGVQPTNEFCITADTTFELNNKGQKVNAPKFSLNGLRNVVIINSKLERRPQRQLIVEIEDFQMELEKNTSRHYHHGYYSIGLMKVLKAQLSQDFEIWHKIQHSNKDEFDINMNYAPYAGLRCIVLFPKPFGGHTDVYYTELNDGTSSKADYHGLEHTVKHKDERKRAAIVQMIISRTNKIKNGFMVNWKVSGIQIPTTITLNTTLHDFYPIVGHTQCDCSIKHANNEMGKNNILVYTSNAVSTNYKHSSLSTN